jgi:hypothetical protein
VTTSFVVAEHSQQPVDDCYARTLRPWTDIGAGKDIRNIAIMSTIITYDPLESNVRMQTNHPRHLHLQPASLVPWITFIQPTP